MSVAELIQLMRLSGTDKVRDYLERVEKVSQPSKTRQDFQRMSRYEACMFLENLETMFLACKRDSIAEAWPTMKENEKPSRPT